MMDFVSFHHAMHTQEDAWIRYLLQLSSVFALDARPLARPDFYGARRAGE